MEIRQLKYFIQVCTDKSVSKAAENLHISQQGLSKTIRNLEDSLGVSLFDRSSKGVQPTELGNLLLEKSQKLVKEFDSMVDCIYDKAKLEKKTLYIGLSHGVYNSFSAAVIYEFQEKYQDIKLEIVELGSYICEKKIEDDLFHICFSVKPDNPENFQFIPICSYNMFLLVNKCNYLSKKSIVEFSDLENEKFIMLSSEYKSRQLIIESCLQSGFEPDIVFTTSQMDLIIELVALNKGLTILPEPILSKAIKISDKVSIISLQDTPKIEMGFIMKKYRNLNHIANTFINYTLNFLKYKKLD